MCFLGFARWKRCFWRTGPGLCWYHTLKTVYTGGTCLYFWRCLEEETHTHTHIYIYILYIYIYHIATYITSPMCFAWHPKTISCGQTCVQGYRPWFLGCLKLVARRISGAKFPMWKELKNHLPRRVSLKDLQVRFAIFLNWFTGYKPSWEAMTSLLCWRNRWICCDVSISNLDSFDVSSIQGFKGYGNMWSYHAVLYPKCVEDQED